ncbi:MAG: hypothetical protein K2Y37_03860 [Pirellulales bacterium]|nr:hypothetical protein [Pirellulales bacterium]
MTHFIDPIRLLSRGSFNSGDEPALGATASSSSSAGSNFALLGKPAVAPEPAFKAAGGCRSRLRLAALAMCAIVLVSLMAAQSALAQHEPVTNPGAAAPAAEAAGAKPAEAAPAESATGAETQPSPESELALVEQELADRFRRFEDVLLRLAEITAAEDPQRAALLRRAVASSKQKLVGVQFERLVELLKEDKLATALTNQGDLLGDLSALLDLLSSEDRAKQLESEQARLKAFLKEVNKLIREQQGLNAQTERASDPGSLSGRQGELAGRTGKLAGDIKASGENKPDESKPAEDESGDDGEKPESDKPSEDQPAEDKPGEPKPSESKPGESQPGESKPGESKPGESQPGESKPGESQPGEPQEGQPQEGQPQPGQPQPGQPGQPQDGQPGQSPDQQQPQDETAPARQRLSAAEARMRNAQERLEKAKRDEAADEQQAALRELEQAKAELERILRQMREEEMARTLAQLEARFRKMLEEQVVIYEGTLRLDRVPAAARGRSHEIEGGRLSRGESQLVLEADKALAILREDGTAVAMPEAVLEVRQDMEQVTLRLAQLQVDELTQGIEQDIIAALEEMIEALEKAQDELEQQRNEQQPPGQPGEPQEPPLVDQLAELKMIRSLQMRINRRTQTYGRLVEGEQASRPELLEALQQLAERQERLERSTHDIATGKNK